jgi:hypothetical protein
LADRRAVLPAPSLQRPLVLEALLVPRHSGACLLERGIVVPRAGHAERVVARRSTVKEIDVPAHHLVADAVVPRGHKLPERGPDHYFAAPDLDRRTVASTRALLAQIEDETNGR